MAKRKKASKVQKRAKLRSRFGPKNFFARSRRAYCVFKAICRVEKSKSFKMTRRERWRRVLDIEVRRWSAMTPEQLASALNKEQVYEVELDSKTYQVEVEMLKSTEEYFQVMVAVDDGSLPASIVPETQIFICNKKFRNL